MLDCKGPEGLGVPCPQVTRARGQAPGDSCPRPRSQPHDSGPLPGGVHSWFPIPPGQLTLLRILSPAALQPSSPPLGTGREFFPPWVQGFSVGGAAGTWALELEGTRTKQHRDSSWVFCFPAGSRVCGFPLAQALWSRGVCMRGLPSEPWAHLGSERGMSLLSFPPLSRASCCWASETGEYGLLPK